MKLYDAHCHLNEEHIFPRREECLQRFVDARGAGIVNVGANQFYNEKGIEIAVASKDSSVVVKATIWFHPEGVGTEIQQKDFPVKMEELKNMIMNNRGSIVGVGECGFDLHYPWAETYLDLQKELFVLQCELSRELDLPLVVHSRDAFDQTLDVLKNFKDLVVYFHCRGYGPEELKKLQEADFRKLYIGFCGNVTYKKADVLRESLKLVPLDSLLLETDAPYLAPQIVRGEENEPANVKYIYEFVAETLNIAPESLSQQLETNFKTLYKLD